jgi:hypothetical protein
MQEEQNKWSQQLMVPRVTGGSKQMTQSAGGGLLLLSSAAVKVELQPLPWPETGAEGMDKTGTAFAAPTLTSKPPTLSLLRFRLLLRVFVVSVDMMCLFLL